MRRTESIFPFECHLSGPGYDFKGYIMSMNQNGFVCNTGPQIMRTSVTLNVVFNLPLTTKRVEAPVIAYRTYDKFKGQHGSVNPGDHLTEFIYKAPSDEFKRMMTQFMAHVQAHSL